MRKRIESQVKKNRDHNNLNALIINPNKWESFHELNQNMSVSNKNYTLFDPVFTNFN